MIIIRLVNSIEEIGHRPFSESDPIERGIY